MKGKASRVFIVIMITAAICFSYQTEEKREDVYAMVGGTLIDGTGGQPVKDAIVLIKGEKIESAGPAAEVNIPKGAEKIDVSGKWILPGFIDCHIHLGYFFSTLEYFTDSDSLATIRALKIMNAYLRCGVTSVRDVGSPIEPMTLEAILLYCADEMDSKANAFNRIISRSRKEGQTWTEWVNLMNRYLYAGGTRESGIDDTLDLK